MDIYKSLNINIGTVMKNSEMLKFVPDYLKTKKMCKHVLKKLRYVSIKICFWSIQDSTNMW